MANEAYPPAELRAGRHVRKLWGELPLYCITPEEFAELPDGTPLVCIDGLVHVKGEDEFDMDTRFGVIAFGFLKATSGGLERIGEGKVPGRG